MPKIEIKTKKLWGNRSKNERRTPKIRTQVEGNSPLQGIAMIIEVPR